MTRLASFGAAIAMAAVLIGCAPIDPAPTTTTSGPPTTVGVECDIERATIELALDAFEATESRFPESLGELAAAGWLKHPPGPEWTYTSDGETYTLTGPC